MRKTKSKTTYTTLETIKKKIKIPYISCIYYDTNDNKNEKSKYLNDLRIKYEILEDNELEKKDELLDDFIKDNNNLLSSNLISYQCKNHENQNGKKYCLKCHYWLCNECVEEHIEKNILHPLSENEINLIEICNEHNKNLTLYCNNCKKFICHECLKEKHKEHSYEKIKDKWRKEKNKYKYFYQDNFEDLINDSKDCLNKYSKKTIDYINKIINDLNGIKVNIQEAVEKMKDDYDSIKTLYDKMIQYMKLARNYPNNNIIESIKNLNFQDINFKLSFETQNDKAINLLKDEIYNTLNQFIIFIPNQKIENQKKDVKINSLFTNINNNINTNNNNFNNQNNLFSNSTNNIFANPNGLFSNNTNVFTIKETRKIDPFENLKKDLEKKNEEKIDKEIKKSKQITSILNNNNNANNTLNSSITSLQTQYSESAGNEIVYVTSTGSCYHNKYCRYLWKSCIPMKKKDAIRQGYHSCSRC